MRSRRQESGAALVIAIAIMTILLAIALTFFTLTRLDVGVSTNVTNSVRADQITNGAINIAIAHLNQDFLRHPNVTSTDHAWRTVFNGAWVAGKPWALRNEVPLQQGGVPYIDLNNLPFASLSGVPKPLYVYWPADNVREKLFQGARSKEWLYYPRVEMLGGKPVLYDPGAKLQDANFNDVNTSLYFVYDPNLSPGQVSGNHRPPDFFPYVTSDLYDTIRRNGSTDPAFTFLPGSEEFISGRGGDGGYQYPAEQIAQWADVDNNGDGWRDSMWIPIPADMFYADDHLDNNLNGLVDEQQNNGINEDTDFYPGQPADQDFALGLQPPYWQVRMSSGNIVYDPDEAIEAGVFVYWGGDDGLDNDGNGLIDANDPNETGNQGYFLTAPLPGEQILVDLNADGISGDLVPDTTGTLRPLKVILPPFITVTVPDRNAPFLDSDGDSLPDTPTAYTDIIMSEAKVDHLDNDFDLVVNDYFAYAYCGPNNQFTPAIPPFVLSGFERVGANVMMILDYNAVNSYSTVNQYKNPVYNNDGNGFVSASALGDYYGDAWRQPGNWFLGLDAPNGKVVSDELLFAAARMKSYLDINLESVLRNTGGLIFDPPSGVALDPSTNDPVTLDYGAMMGRYIRITHSGEPVCELVGRAAILITDESSKLNLNAVGGESYTRDPSNLPIVRRRTLYNDVDTIPLARALTEPQQGLSASEIDTRVLPLMDYNKSTNLWTLLNGRPKGEDLDPVPYAYDAWLPGYGRVDDNGNAMLLAMNGLDDDGDGLVDEGLFLPDLPLSSDPDYDYKLRIYNTYLSLLGDFEGIDEPQERSTFRPLRNFIAERDGLDNDNDGVIDEIGELGDRLLQDNKQIMEATGIAEGTYNYVARLTTPYSTDRNSKFVSTEKGIRAINRLDFNYATPQHLASALIIAGKLKPNTEGDYFKDSDDSDAKLAALPAVAIFKGMAGEARRFAEGLRQGDTHFSAPAYPVADTALDTGGFLYIRDVASNLSIPATQRLKNHFLPADPQLQAMQLAVDLVDDRDVDYGRSLLTTERMDLQLSDTEKKYYTPWPESLSQSEEIPQTDLLPMEDIETYLVKTLNVDDQRTQSVDKWWADRDNNLATVDGVVDDMTTTTPEKRQERHISYTSAGAEAIRINELMVRPVRRVEAEMSMLAPTDAGYTVNLDPSPYPGMLQFDMKAGILTEDYISGLAGDGWVFADNDGQNSVQAPLGANSAWVLNTAATTNPAWLDSGMSAQIPNVIQFEFRATDGLPPGRYYLTVNVTGWDADGNWGPTVEYPSEAQPAVFDLQYAVKYCTSGTGDTILDDIARVAVFEEANYPLGYTNYYFEDVENRQFIGRTPDGTATGMVFLPGTLRKDTSPDAELAALEAAPNDPYNPYDVNKPVRLDTYWWDGLRSESSPYRNVPSGTPPMVPRPALRTFTVTIPDPAVDPYDTLCVAIRLNPERAAAASVGVPAPRLAINSFEFSQEPDHEWVELTNVSNQPVDVTGWQLEVGIPKVKFGPDDPNRSVWSIGNGFTAPGSYVIAPGGMMLLTFDSQTDSLSQQEALNKYDLYRTPPTAARNLINSNGIGVCALAHNDSALFGGYLDISNVTVPPIPGASYYVPYTALPILSDATGSAFRRIYDSANPAKYVDFIDRDGDGLSSYWDAISAAPQWPDTDNALAENIQSSPTLPTDDPSAVSSNSGVRPWDRIVPLTNRRLWKDGNNAVTMYDLKDEEEESVGRLAQWVLRGGVLPNYPEHDGYDNDGDGGYIKADPDNSASMKYVRGTLDKDWVDNNLDGYIDTWFLRSNNTPGTTAADTADDVLPVPYRSEGVDEGRDVGAAFGRRYGLGSYEAGTIPLVFVNTSLAFMDSSLVAPVYVDEPNDQLDYFSDITLFSLSDGFVALNGAVNGPADDATRQYITRVGDSVLDQANGNVQGINTDGLYVGSDNDPPEWKAFLERRWNPGDCVIVTLYAGTVEEGKVADRVTYRELDVTNRTVDDIAPCPYTVLDSTGTAVRDTLNAEYASMWLPDQVGLDFYRSLERKHVLYHGDRFGTSNRWEATDGNYDDWAESMSVFEQIVSLDEYPFSLKSIEVVGGSGATSVGPQLLRFNDTTNINDANPLLPDERRLMWHSFFGSPLRMNVAQRMIDNPNDLLRWAEGAATVGARPMQQFVGVDYLETVFETAATELDQVKLRNPDYTYRAVEFRNGPFQSVADLSRFPNMVLHQRMLNVPASGATPENAYLFDATRINAGYYNRSDQNPYWYQRQTIGFQSALLGTDSIAPTADQVGRTMQDMAAVNPQVLTVAQADFTPIRPCPGEPSYPAGVTLDDLLTVDFTTKKFPAAWAPVFLFALPNDEVAGPNQKLFPYYPTYWNGTQGGLIASNLLYYLFDADQLYPDKSSMLNAPGMTDAALKARWPLEKRIVMYWSQPNLAMNEKNLPEAVFTWDAEDGLENGDYMLYVCTVTGDLAGKLADFDALVTGAALTTKMSPFGLAYESQMNLNGNSSLAIEAITDPTKGRGFVAEGAASDSKGLKHPNKWMQTIVNNPSGIQTLENVGVYTPGPDGTIFYGDNAAGGWLPKMVHVTDNFLALRVRNVGQGLSAISHIVLTPRKRVPGKVNVNTAAYQTARLGNHPNQRDQMYNPLLAVPGVVDALNTVFAFGADNPVGPPLPASETTGALERPVPTESGDDTQSNNPWQPLELFTGMEMPPTISSYDNPKLLASNADQYRTASMRLSSLIMAGRREHADGRYYESLSELADDAYGFVFRYPDNTTSGVLRPLSNEKDSDRRLRDMLNRFERMANSLTVRSDVFEIITTVQAGYGIDLNNDGWINYRSNDEFVTSAETKGRVVYERRAPSDMSDEPTD